MNKRDGVEITAGELQSGDKVWYQGKFRDARVSFPVNRDTFKWQGEVRADVMLADFTGRLLRFRKDSKVIILPREES